VGSGNVVETPEEGTQASDGQDSLEARGTLTGERFPRSSRLHAAAEFEQVHQRGRRRKLGFLDVWWTDNQAGHPRMGLIVPKFQSSVVARNRLRRRLRELWRREFAGTIPAWDVVIRTRSEAYRASFAELRDDLVAWRTRAV
jgi:ribonuclease P protein component